MANLKLNVVTPEKEIYSDTVDQVVVPAPGGAIGILPHHTRLMSKVSPGELIITKGNELTELAVGEGVVQVGDMQVTILTDTAVRAEEVDEVAAEEARQRALSALRDLRSDEEYATTLAALERAVAQLRIKRRKRSN